MKGHFINKFLVIFVGIIFTLPCITISNSYAQEKTAIGGQDKIKEMLLRPGGWLVEWRGNSSGVIEFIFEDRSDNIVVKINNPAWDVKCERNVTISGDVVKLDGCNEKNISLNFDPNDNEYPFKGESPCCYYKLKAK
jgi:hypothetical protein